jgi:hypothetical protein
MAEATGARRSMPGLSRSLDRGDLAYRAPGLFPLRGERNQRRATPSLRSTTERVWGPASRAVAIFFWCVPIGLLQLPTINEIARDARMGRPARTEAASGRGALQRSLEGRDRVCLEAIDRSPGT